ncbi:MAG: alpha-glucosidase [Chloroflexi bacterium]|nr:MAG: alpha-glucosidase [Chloroflexota bacterium]
MSQRIVLIGAGSSNFGLGTVGDLFKNKAFEGSHIVLHDINPFALKRVHDVASKHIAEHQLPFTVSASIDRKEALQGATFVVISIEVGGRFELWDQDWQIPLRYGIRQIYGENGGPGGLFHSLRIVPPILAICEDIQAICPEAFVFNFSNPMSRICTTVTRKFPDLKFVGLCHEIASLPEFLPQILDTPLSNIAFRAGGLNHFSVLLEVSYKDSGKDAYPDVRAKAPAFFASMPERMAAEEDWFVRDTPDEIKQRYAALGLAQPKPWPERDLFRVILEEFGYMPITTDSHFGEYVQWAHAVVDHQAILDFYRSYQLWCTLNSVADRVEGTDEGWTIAKIMAGIVEDARYEEPAVNVPNAGFIANLPQDIVVEVPGTVDKDGIHGVCMGSLPKGIAGLLSNQYAVHDLTAEAILTGSKKAALQALLLDPVVHSYHAAKETLDTMIAVQNKYLGYLR